MKLDVARLTRRVFDCEYALNEKGSWCRFVKDTLVDLNMEHNYVDKLSDLGLCKTRLFILYANIWSNNLMKTKQNWGYIGKFMLGLHLAVFAIFTGQLRAKTQKSRFLRYQRVRELKLTKSHKEINNGRSSPVDKPLLPRQCLRLSRSSRGTIRSWS